MSKMAGSYFSSYQYNLSLEFSAVLKYCSIIHAIVLTPLSAFLIIIITSSILRQQKMFTLPHDLLLIFVFRFLENGKWW
jgi:hypothetical protein